MPSPVVVDFYLSPASPYCYLAGTQMMALQLETACRVDWYPVAGRSLIGAAGYDPQEAAHHSGQYRPEYRRQDIERWARLYGVEYRWHGDIVIQDPVRLALAATAARRFDAGQVFIRALMRAIFVEHKTPTDDLCVQIANDTAGIEPHLFRPMLDDPETRSLNQGYVEAALAAGCFGVPSFVVDKREMVFGNDRIPLLKQAIQEARAAAG